jgi:hypothetical protein
VRRGRIPLRLVRRLRGGGSRRVRRCALDVVPGRRSAGGRFGVFVGFMGGDEFLEPRVVGICVP